MRGSKRTPHCAAVEREIVDECFAVLYVVKNEPINQRTSGRTNKEGGRG